jgi:hypothetical protein
MDTEEIDAAPGSSPATGDQTETSPPSPDGPRDSSTAGDQSQTEAFLQKAAELDGEEPEGAETSPVTTTATEPAGEGAPVQDEPDANDPEGSEQPEALSQAQQQQQTEQRFTERPEWGAALKLVPAAKAPEMRKILRNLMTRESELTGQYEKAKPAVAITERIRSAVGAEGVENAVALVELWNRGDERAEGMLTELLHDLQTRRGARISSPDLVKRDAAIRSNLEAGLIEEGEAEEQRKVLLELERTRAGLNQKQAAQDQQAKAEQARKTEALVTERTSAINDWEKQIAKSDPDYLYKRDADTPSLQEQVLNDALRVVNEKQAQRKDLLPAADMLAILKAAYARQKAFIGQRQRPNRTPITGRGSSTNSRRTPMTPEEEFLQKADELGA